MKNVSKLNLPKILAQLFSTHGPKILLRLYQIGYCVVFTVPTDNIHCHFLSEAFSIPPVLFYAKEGNTFK